MRTSRLACFIIAIGLASATCSWVSEKQLETTDIGPKIYAPIAVGSCNYHLSGYTVYSFMYTCNTFSKVTKTIYNATYDCTGTSITVDVSDNSIFDCQIGGSACGSTFGYLTSCGCSTSVGDCEYGFQYSVVSGVCVPLANKNESAYWTVECGSSSSSKVTQEMYLQNQKCTGDFNFTSWITGCQTLGPTKTQLEIMICPSTMASFSFVGLLVTLVLALSM